MPVQWTPEKLRELSAAFQECRIMLTAAELDLFTKLKKGPRTVDDLAREEGWNRRALRILLDALASQDLLTKYPDGLYGVQEPMATALVKGAEASILPMVLLLTHGWRTWSNLTDIVRTGENPNVKTGESSSVVEMELFIDAMHVVGRKMADVIAASVDLNPFKRMLDLGGGSGTYTTAFLKKAPHLRATLFDLPEVVELAKRRLSESGYRDRVTLVSGDYTTDELPGGHDLVLLSAVIHSNGREENQALYSRIYNSLEPGGAILIRDYLMDESRTNPPDGAMFAVNMLVATESGDTYTFEEVREDLEKAGFKNVQLIRQGEHMDQLVTAAKD